MSPKTSFTPEGSAMVLLSGGQDSLTCLVWAKRNFKHVEAISFTYGQRHAKEVILAIRNARKWGVTEHDVISLLDYGIAVKSALTNKIEAIKETEKFPTSFVPLRNMVFFSIAAGVAYSRGIRNLVGGMCQTDYSGYPDCRSVFVRACESTINHALGTQGENTIHIFTPLMHLDKGQTFKLAEELGCLRDVIEWTLTCYEACETVHPWGKGCGACPACKLRARGYADFKKAKGSGRSLREDVPSPGDPVGGGIREDGPESRPDAPGDDREFEAHP